MTREILRGCELRGTQNDRIEMRDHLIITRAAELEALAAFRDFIARTCEQFGVAQEITFQLQLACDEAATNVIQHGYAGMNPGSIMLEVRPSPQHVTMVLSDFGQPFEPVATEAPDLHALLQDRPTTGFGLYFIYQTMDDVNNYSDEQGNHLVLIKNLTREASRLKWQTDRKLHS